jgi:hypothetical protein
MKNQNQLSSNEIQRGVQAAEDELQQAREEHAKAAYAHAVDREDPAARDAVIAAKRRMDLLQAEMQGLGAAAGEAARREQAASLDSQLNTYKRDQAEAVKAINAVPVAFERAAKAITQLGEELKALQEAEQNANRLEGRLVITRYSRIPNVSYRTRLLVDALLWLAIGNRELTRSDIVIDFTGKLMPDNPAKSVQRSRERALREVQRGVDEKVAELGSASAVQGGLAA